MVLWQKTGFEGPRNSGKMENYLQPRNRSVGKGAPLLSKLSQL